MPQDESPPAESKLSAVQRENQRLQEEIQKLMMHNTKLQRELMGLNAAREQIVAEGHERVAQLTDELKQIDTELNTVRGDCDRILAVIVEHKEISNMRSLGDLSLITDVIEEEDFQSDHSTASTASSTSSYRSSRSASRADFPSRKMSGRPPLPSKKMSIDIDEDQIPEFTKLQTRGASVSAAVPMQGSSARDTIMSRIARSVKKTQSMPVMAGDRPSIQHGLDNHSPMLGFKANSVLRSTHAHLNNFRRHSGPYRRNKDTVVL